MASNLMLTLSRLRYNNHPLKGVIQSSVAEIAALISGKSAAEALPLWSNVSPLWDSSVFKPNPDCWAASLRTQLTSIPAWKSSALQAYGGWAITPRHVLGGSDTPSLAPVVGTQIRFANPANLNGSGECEIFSTEVTHVHRTVSDVVGLLADELPSWVHKLPIFEDSKAVYDYLAYNGMLRVVISQNGSLTDPPNAATPDGPKIFIGYHSQHPLFIGGPSVQFSNDNEWSHNIYPGDSGLPEMYLIEDSLYVFRANVGGEFPFASAAVNASIANVDTQAGISTGYTVTVAPDPTA
jgi:hypothetical protein